MDEVLQEYTKEIENLRIQISLVDLTSSIDKEEIFKKKNKAETNRYEAGAVKRKININKEKITTIKEKILNREEKEEKEKKEKIAVASMEIERVVLGKLYSEGSEKKSMKI